jgi:hypothetical protein
MFAAARILGRISWLFPVPNNHHQARILRTTHNSLLWEKSFDLASPDVKHYLVTL